MLQDLNQFDYDDDITRAKFWLTYKSEVKNVLTTRKTEVLNQMKEMVVECKCTVMFLLFNLIFVLMYFVILQY